MKDHNCLGGKAGGEEEAAAQTQLSQRFLSELITNKREKGDRPVKDGRRRKEIKSRTEITAGEISELDKTIAQRLAMGFRSVPDVGIAIADL